MRAIVMRVSAVSEHPGADSLRIYKFIAPGFESGLQIVANMENTYGVGDLAVVAMVGSALKSGERISKATLRGVDSFGMALGPAGPGAALGDDMTDRFCIKPLTTGRVIKWSSIESFHHIRKGMKVRMKNDPDFAPPVVTYYGKVKLHGTNAGIQLLKDGTVRAQGRNRVLTTQDDNLGFASWVSKNQDCLRQTRLCSLIDIILYGEWCGKGVQKGVAISDIDRKVFAVFAVQIGLGDMHSPDMVIEPTCIRKLVPEHPDIFVIPWYSSHGVVVDWGGDKTTLELRAAEINRQVALVEERDPWVHKTFGVSGTGEGLVMYPHDIEGDRNYTSLSLKEVGPTVDCHKFSELMFKAKGDKHKVVKQKHPAQVDPEVANSVAGFVDMMLPDARLEQGVTEACGGEAEMKSTGAFLKWIGNDVRKEGQAELEASSLEWKQVAKAVNDKARKWFVGRAKEL